MTGILPYDGRWLECDKATHDYHYNRHEHIVKLKNEIRKHYFSFTFAKRESGAILSTDGMDVRHRDKELEALESDPEHRSGFERSLVRQFRKVMNLLRTVQHETELYAWKGLRFKKLSGDRDHQRSLRLNNQWRLIVEIEHGDSGNTCVVIGIEDYH